MISFRNIFDVLLRLGGSATITATSWFWPLLSICLALALSIPCTLITIVVICHKQNREDNSDQASIESGPSSLSSSSSSYSIPHQQRRTCHHHRSHLSHYAGGLLSPPPPYTAIGETIHAVNPPSIPPPYEPPTITVNPRPSLPTTEINSSSVASNANQPSINGRVETIHDTSSSITNQSIQTFQA